MNSVAFVFFFYSKILAQRIGFPLSLAGIQLFIHISKTARHP